MSDEKSLEGAYALETKDDVTRLYADWAESYDASFADSHGYVAPRNLAAIFEAERDGPGPVLDIGAGTGLVAEHLSGEVDGLDLSPEMLRIAAEKRLYRNRIVGDLTAELPIETGSYAGLISAGTFTHGHVGPVCLPELMRIARPGALFCLSINAEVFDKSGFGSAFAALVADGTVAPMRFQHLPFYAPDQTHDHANDHGLVAIFNRI
ncbi:MAG: class I SAM-dependent methyltransferase [Pseudomonadota bacterium]